MPSARIDFRQLTLEVEKQIGTIPAYRRYAIAVANETVSRARNKLIEKFDEDAITQEIEAGEDAVGSSFLPAGYGNLFSFIGFYQDEHPIDELRAFIEHNISLVQTPVTEAFSYIFRVNVPTPEEIAQVTPMPFGTASSWALAIEKGIPGFNRYLFDLEREFAASRSGPAIQTDEKHILRDAEYTPQPYLFEKLFPEFERTLLSAA